MACLKNKTQEEILAADAKITDKLWTWGFVQDSKYLPGRLEEMVLSRPPRPVMLGNVHDEEEGSRE